MYELEQLKKLHLKSKSKLTHSVLRPIKVHTEGLYWVCTRDNKKFMETIFHLTS